MIPKLIQSDSRRGTFSTLVNYIARDKDEHAEERELFGAPERGAQNLDCDPVDAAQIMNDTAGLVRRSKQDPVNHIVISWQAGEHPTKVQVDHAVTHMLKAIGMREAQAVWAVHRDTDYDHVHIALNRIHPTRGTWLSMPQRSYAVMHKACREIELLQGWQNSRGAFIVQDGHVTRRDPDRPGPPRGPSGRARRAEKNVGAPPFQVWVSRDPAAAARGVVARPGANWQDLHQALSRYGVRVQPGERRGLVVVTQLGERTIAGKASLLGLGNLLKRLGPYQAPMSPRADPSTPVQTYGRFVEGFQRGDISWEPDAPASAAANSAERIAASSNARRALHARFIELHGPVAKAEKAAGLVGLREQQALERRAHRDAVKVGRQTFFQDARERGIPTELARSMWAADVARQRDAMRAQHATQRQQLGERYAHAAAWREWLTDQAARGDEEAGRALRGLRYRETRATARQQNGIEGEEVSSFRPGALAALRADVDMRRQLIIYRDTVGRARFTDHGPRIEVHGSVPQPDTVEAAILLAAEKYGGEVSISGSSEFRELATRTAVRLGVRVRDRDLQELVRNARQSVGWRQPSSRGDELER